MRYRRGASFSSTNIPIKFPKSIFVWLSLLKSTLKKIPNEYWLRQVTFLFSTDAYRNYLLPINFRSVQSILQVMQPLQDFRKDQDSVLRLDPNLNIENPKKAVNGLVEKLKSTIQMLDTS